MKWVRRERSDDHLAYDPHEPGLWELMERRMPEDGVFLDVGAHVGRYTVRFALHGHRVYAVEPGPAQLAGLKENLRLNDVEHMVTILPYVAWDCEAGLALRDPKGSFASGSTYAVEGGTFVGKPIDDMGIGQVDLVKIDVEGAEGRVLRGMRKLVASCHPLMIIEMHDRGDPATGVAPRPELKDEVFEVLAGMGYGWETVYEYRQAWYVEAFSC